MDRLSHGSHAADQAAMRLAGQGGVGLPHDAASRPAVRRFRFAARRAGRRTCADRDCPGRAADAEIRPGKNNARGHTGWKAYRPSGKRPRPSTGAAALMPGEQDHALFAQRDQRDGPLVVAGTDLVRARAGARRGGRATSANRRGLGAAIRELRQTWPRAARAIGDHRPGGPAWRSPGQLHGQAGIVGAANRQPVSEGAMRSFNQPVVDKSLGQGRSAVRAGGRDAALVTSPWILFSLSCRASATCLTAR